MLSALKSLHCYSKTKERRDDKKLHYAFFNFLPETSSACISSIHSNRMQSITLNGLLFRDIGETVVQNREGYMKIAAYKNYSTRFTLESEIHSTHEKFSSVWKEPVPRWCGGRSGDDDEDFLRSYYSNDRSHSRVAEVTTVRALSKCLTIRVEVLLKFHQTQSG